MISGKHIKFALITVASLSALIFAFPFRGSAQQAPQQQGTKPAPIDKNGMLILIRSSLYALDLSNKSGNYTILREMSAPGFAAVNDAARLSASFRSQRDRNLDFSGVLVYEPTMTTMPEIDKNGMMHFAGYFPSASSQINFEMIFEPVNGRWKLFGLAADVGPAGPAAPTPPRQAPAIPAAAKQAPASEKQ
ncbi:MAG: hypothetical protein ACKOJB_05965 [Chthoniobacterales bacterium]